MMIRSIVSYSVVTVESNVRCCSCCKLDSVFDELFFFF